VTLFERKAMIDKNIKLAVYRGGESITVSVNKQKKTDGKI
jgi:hypothetical protein